MNQIEILKYLEEQKTTRTITDLIVHCTATKPGAKVNVDVIDGWHKERGFKKQPQSGRICGYHFVVLPDGTIETGRYLMFYILRCHSYKPYVDEHYYIYDKKDNQIYKMTDYPGNSYWTLMDDYPHITNWNTTQNSHIAVRTRQVYALQEAEGKHGDAELKKLIETLDDDANPVLQIMLFHTVDQIKK